MHVKSWQVHLVIDEDQDITTVRAVLSADGSVLLEGHGRARRDPHDPSVPDIGDEVAAARALRDLSDAVFAAAAGDIAAYEQGLVRLSPAASGG